MNVNHTKFLVNMDFSILKLHKWVIDNLQHQSRQKMPIKSLIM